MGANCCVAGREKPFPDDPRYEVSTCRNVRYSPSWSFRWDNRTHIEDIMDNPARFSHHGGRDSVSEIKSAADTETEALSSEGSPPGAFEKSFIKTGVPSNSKDGAPEQSLGSNSSHEEKETIKSGSFASASDTNPSSSSAFNLDPSPSRTHSFPSDPTSLRQAHHSPGFQLSRQVSDSRIPSLKSQNQNSSPEERQSFVLSFSGNDLPAVGSQGRSSDGWSMRTFTELVASSQRERWPIHTESMKANLQTCGVCSKLLKEGSSWVASELSVVAVLVCGHVYHADCLENMTAETDRFEPPCPVCTNGEKATSKPLRKAELKARSKRSRIAVADVNGNFDSSSASKKEFEKGPRMGTSSSMKSSFVRPFLRRHFSTGSRPSRPVSENETTRKGFWARYRRD